MSRESRKNFTGMLLSLLLIGAPMALAVSDSDQHHDNEQQVPSRVLGNISFPTTTESKQAQAAFIEGMLLLHLFEYPFAEEKFQQAQALDTGFAMAYWGEAMTHNHPVWDRQDREAAMAALNKLGNSPEARMSKTASQKEKDYFAALELLYGDGDKADRDQAYMHHMQQMAAHYLGDHEVQLFYALSILGASAGVRDIPAYMQSTAISQGVFYTNRQHAGAAHYLIHGVDDPVHAPLGLEAARALAVLAPDAGHSLHMTSHIFTAQGMWDDVISANQSAVLVQNKMRVSHGEPARHWGHYNFWLIYGFLQQGRHKEATELLNAANKEAVESGAVPEDPLVLNADRSQIGSLVQIWGRYMIETRGKDREIAAWTFNMGDAFDPILTFNYVLALDNARFEEISKANHHLNMFRTTKDKLGKAIFEMERQAPSDLLYLDRLNVMEQEILAVIAFAEKKPDLALEHAREASRMEGEMPFSFGPPFVDLPSAELLGGLLLETGHYEQASQAYEIQLERTRLKSKPLMGLAEAEEKQGNKNAANRAREMLKVNWSKADFDIDITLVSEY